MSSKYRQTLGQQCSTKPLYRCVDARWRPDAGVEYDSLEDFCNACLATFGYAPKLRELEDGRVLEMPFGIVVLERLAPSSDPSILYMHTSFIPKYREDDD